MTVSERESAEAATVSFWDGRKDLPRVRSTGEWWRRAPVRCGREAAWWAASPVTFLAAAAADRREGTA